MFRCKESAGRFRLTFIALHEPVGYTVQIVGHHDFKSADGEVIEPAPVAIKGPPQELELCIHEVAWMRGMPGKDYRLDYDFKLEPLG